MSAASSEMDRDSLNANDGTDCDKSEAEAEASTCMEPSQSRGRQTEIEKAAPPTAAAGAAASGSLPASADSSPQTTRDRSHAQAAKVNDEDIDPFTYRPPLTKWDYVKVLLKIQYSTGVSLQICSSIAVLYMYVLNTSPENINSISAYFS